MYRDPLKGPVPELSPFCRVQASVERCWPETSFVGVMLNEHRVWAKSNFLTRMDCHKDCVI